VNLAFSEEQRLIQKAVRRFIEEELLPIEMKVPAGWWLPPEHHQPLVRKAQALGLWALEVPVRFGGGGLDCVTSALIHEEMGKCTVGNAVLGAPAPMYLYDGTPYQVDRYLLPVVRGEQRDFFALTEPHTGADPASMKTRAVRDGECYVINGFRVADRAMQIHGAAETASDLPIERYWRDVRHHRIGEGSQEVMKFVIARNLLRD